MDTVMQETLQDSQEVWAEQIEAISLHEDRAAFAKIFEYFAPRIKGFILQGFESQISPDMADELAQEVMLKVWRKAASYSSSKARVSTWIYTIARNTRIDALRKNKLQESSLDSDDIWYEPEDEETPFDQLQQERTAQLIKQHLQHLSEDQRQVIHKSFMEGKSHSEIAQALDLPLGTVKSRVRLAMKKLAISIDR